MKNRPSFPHFALLVALAAVVQAAPAIADKPSWAGGGKEDKAGKKHEERYEDQRHDGGHGSTKIGFGDTSRKIVYEYYGEQFRTGTCPPGLAKKNNGCMPPGQAKKWKRGHPLPADLRQYDLPRDLVIRLPAAPADHRYVRVAADILLIAIGTSMVVDAIEDIGR